MARKQLIVALGALALSSPLMATSVDPASVAAAPSGGPETRYCLKVGPVTGNIAETVECWTRDEWADQGVDVDKEWAKNGVRTLG